MNRRVYIGTLVCVICLALTLVLSDSTFGVLSGLLAVLRIVSAVIFILFLPGYHLQGALFPGRTQLDLFERLALSFSISTALMPPIALLLDKTPWGLSLSSVFFAYTIVVLFLMGLQIVRQNRAERVTQGQDEDEAAPAPAAQTQPRLRRILLIIFVVASFVGSGFALSLISTWGTSEYFTEFYLLGSGGDAQDYTISLVEGSSTPFTVGIRNMERAATTYRVEIKYNEFLLDEIDSPMLDRGERWEHPINLSADAILEHPSSGQEVDRIYFTLYNSNIGDVPYLRLQVWVNPEQADR